LSEAFVDAKFELIVILIIVLLDFKGFVLETRFEVFEKGFDSLVADLLVVDTMDNRPACFVL
jgi:hypothetical protein